MKRLFQWAKANGIILVNAGSLVGTTAVTSVLGFLYWWLAARQFPPIAVGIASAAISAMSLLGNLSTLGLGTMLIGELPLRHGKRGALISASLLLTSVIGIALGLVYASATVFFLTGSKVLGTSPTALLIFALGVGFSALTLVLDQSLIGLLRGELQLWRNALFAIVKLAALFVVSSWLSHLAGIAIYVTWIVGNIVSLLFLLVLILVKKGRQIRSLLPHWKLLQHLRATALKHHALNLTLDAPSLILPVLVTILLSATQNAWFYVAWSLATIANSISSALSITLYAVGSAQPSLLARKMRLTLFLAFIACALLNCVLLFGTEPVLNIFGKSYASQAIWCLRFLSLESFPFIIKNHYITLSRIHGRVGRTTLLTVVTGLFELGMSITGIYFMGLNGLSLGWTVAISIEALFMTPTIIKAVTDTHVPVSPKEEQLSRAEPEILLPETLIQTGSMPAIQKFNKDLLLEEPRVSDDDFPVFDEDFDDGEPTEKRARPNDSSLRDDHTLALSRTSEVASHFYWQ